MEVQGTALQTGETDRMQQLGVVSRRAFLVDPCYLQWLITFSSML